MQAAGINTGGSTTVWKLLLQLCFYQGCQMPLLLDPAPKW
jgi:hypothetical protein